MLDNWARKSYKATSVYVGPMHTVYQKNGYIDLLPFLANSQPLIYFPQTNPEEENNINLSVKIQSNHDHHQSRQRLAKKQQEEELVDPYTRLDHITCGLRIAICASISSSQNS